MHNFSGLLKARNLFPVYPVTQTVYAPGKPWPTRIQIALSPPRYFLLTQHAEGHWCAYALIPKAKWDNTLWSPANLATLGYPITYAGFSTDSICWMDRTKASELRHPVQLSDQNTNPDGDFWVGTHSTNLASYDPKEWFDGWMDVATLEFQL